MNQTIREYLESHLYQMGMFPDQAKAVVDLFEAEDEIMKGRFNDTVSDYPPPMLMTLNISIRPYALKWIDANLPSAWYRSLFV